MQDWIKIAKQRQLDDYLASTKRVVENQKEIEELREAEKNWMERVRARVDQINAEGFFIHVIKKEKEDILRLVSRGDVVVELLEPSCFALTYKNIMPPTTLRVRNPIFVHHHRVVEVRYLNAHNIEEVLKFVALGMKEYLKISPQSRIEHNLEGIITTLKKDEHEQNG